MTIWQWCSRLSLALFFITVGMATWFLARKIPSTGFQSEFDPGPRAIPLFLATVLVLGGSAAGWQAIRSELLGTKAGTARAFWLLAGGLVVYALAMPHLGFALSTMILGSVMVWSLGSRWWVAGLVTLGLVTIVHVLFVYLFKVPLPQGQLSLPF